MTNSGKTEIESFEDLYVYQMARDFSRKIGKLINLLPEGEKYNLISQMKRAKLSVTNNIAEGFGRYHFQENIQFCRQSKGSICELIDDFNECYDEGYIDQASRDDFKCHAFALLKVLNNYIASQKKLKEQAVNK
jgi:four helix bundle protein